MRYLVLLWYTWLVGTPSLWFLGMHRLIWFMSPRKPDFWEVNGVLLGALLCGLVVPVIGLSMALITGHSAMAVAFVVAIVISVMLPITTVVHARRS